MNYIYGKYHEQNSIWKHSPKDAQNTFKNGITRRNRQLAQYNPSRMPSTSLFSANIKALRLYRHICRLLPYIIKIHEIQHRTTPQQAKIYVGNHFRANSQITDLVDIDFKIDVGYEWLHEAQFHYSQTGYLYKYLMSPKGTLNDHGIDRFDDARAERTNRTTPTSPFLKKFYKGYKSYEI